MLETTFGMNFFLKTPFKPTKLRMIYVRITVDGIIKETSTHRKWFADRWCNKSDSASGKQEDARAINAFLESLKTKVINFKTELIQKEETVTSMKIINFINGKSDSKKLVLEEFQLHNDEIKALIPDEYAKGTHQRFVTARSHVSDFIKYKYQKEDLEFRELNYEFISDYEFYLKTVRNNSRNTALKYISNFKKIVLRAKKKKIIKDDPFTEFTSRLKKVKKQPLTSEELSRLENYQFSIPRLGEVRDIFVFQCYTGLAYIDAYQLKKCDIKIGVDGEMWIHSERQKTDASTYIPLLPKAIEILEKYKNHPLCIKRESVLPVKSNQKMNAYLKEIADLTDIKIKLSTHRARNTFASTVTLNNDVPINVVKELMGHHSVKQTEDYVITEQKTISKNMQMLKEKLQPKASPEIEDPHEAFARLSKELEQLKEKLGIAI